MFAPAPAARVCVSMQPSQPPPSRPSKGESGEGFAAAAAREMADLHCEDIVVFDVRGLSPLTNYIVIGSGTSDRQVKAVAGHVSELARDRFDLEKFGTDRDESSTWLVLDFIDVMVHLFEPATRAHYDLEMLWGDAPTIDWRHNGEHRQSVEG